MMDEEILRALSSALTGSAADVPILRPPAHVDDIVAAEDQLAFKFPLDYRLFLQMTNGSEFVGAVFWFTAELAAYNIEYQYPKFAPWFIAIGSVRTAKQLAMCAPNKACSLFLLLGWITRLQWRATSSSC